jgi:adenosylcobinamide-GDP ribazoletransferase
MTDIVKRQGRDTHSEIQARKEKAALAASGAARYHAHMENTKPEMPQGDAAATPRKPGLAARCVSDLSAMLRFYSRLPVPDWPWERDGHAMPDFARTVWAIPLAGAIIGAVGAAVGAGALALGMSDILVACFVIATLVIITGCFHEDGLADCADGLWGGMTPARRLEIMKDSRIGSYGGAALILSLVLRIFALSELFRLLEGQALWFVIAIAAASRTLALMPTQLLEPATAHGLGAKAQMAGGRACGFALILAFTLLATLAAAHDLLIGLAFTASATGLVLWYVIATARTKIGGYTGDLLGASQQLTEITLMLGFVVALGW